jgi:hypothetical protein
MTLPSEVGRYKDEFDRLSAMALDHRLSLKEIEAQTTMPGICFEHRKEYIRWVENDANFSM